MTTLLAALRRGLLTGWTLATASIAVVALVIGAAVGRPLGDRVYSYQWSDARFCDDCHAHDYANDAWSRSAHAELTSCHDCHRVPIRHYPRNLWVTITAPPQGPDDIPHPEIPLVICASCHVGHCDPHELTGPLPVALCDEVIKIEDTRLHRVHLDAAARTPAPGHGGPPEPDDEDGADPIGCLDCHGAEEGEVHRFAASDTRCVGCHEDVTEKESDAAMACRACHGAGFLQVQPPRPGETGDPGPDDDQDSTHRSQ